jgi:hypothetical protein
MRLSQRQIFSRTCLNEFRIMHSSKIKMKQISRKYAELLSKHLTLIQSNLSQNKNEIRISLKFSNNTILVMKYNFKEQIKTYFISEEKSIYRL